MVDTKRSSGQFKKETRVNCATIALGRLQQKAHRSPVASKKARFVEPIECCVLYRFEALTWVDTCPKASFVCRMKAAFARDFALFVVARSDISCRSFLSEEIPEVTGLLSCKLL